MLKLVKTLIIFIIFDHTTTYNLIDVECKVKVVPLYDYLRGLCFEHDITFIISDFMTEL